MNMENKVNQCVEECQFHMESLKHVLDHYFKIKSMGQSDRINFKTQEIRLRDFVKRRMAPLKAYFNRGKISEEERLSLGSAIAEIFDALEHGLAQLSDISPQNPTQEVK